MWKETRQPRGNPHGHENAKHCINMIEARTMAAMLTTVPTCYLHTNIADQGKTCLKFDTIAGNSSKPHGIHHPLFFTAVLKYVHNHDWTLPLCET